MTADFNPPTLVVGQFVAFFQCNGAPCFLRSPGNRAPPPKSSSLVSPRLPKVLTYPSRRTGDVTRRCVSLRELPWDSFARQLSRPAGPKPRRPSTDVFLSHPPYDVS